MSFRSAVHQVLNNEDLNFLLTNRLPRKAVTQFMGWFSQIQNPVVRDMSIAIWKFFSDLDLSEAKKSEFTSLHDCFTRELKEGQRPVNLAPQFLTSPSDGIVGAHGHIDGTNLIQAKGFPYTLEDLLGDPQKVNTFRDGIYVTLRLTSSMYHRFHAPYDCTIDQVTYIAGDTWNVNPIALQRVEKLFCKNERAVIQARLSLNNIPIAIVPVAAILVASIRLHFVDTLLHAKYGGPTQIPCHAEVKKGQELGWFQHGSTIIVFAPAGSEVVKGLQNGSIIRMGQPLIHLPGVSST